MVLFYVCTRLLSPIAPSFYQSLNQSTQLSSHIPRSEDSQGVVVVILNRIKNCNNLQLVLLLYSSNAMAAAHLLSLKVLRIARPSLIRSNALDFYDSTALESAAIKRGSDEGMLSLPSNFGTLWLGQELACLISLSNESTTTDALTVVLKVSQFIS